MKKSKVAYIEVNDEGKPCMPLPTLLADVAGDAFQNLHWGGLTDRPGKGRRKVRVTVTVEAVK